MLPLKIHPDFSTPHVQSVEGQVRRDNAGMLYLQYTITGCMDELTLLEETAPARTDYLWQKTCFEAFIGAAGEERYLEFNLSPSTEWAVYAFDSHRKGMTNPVLTSDPQISTSQDDDHYRLSAAMDLTGLPGMEAAELDLAMTAVVEEHNGYKSLWALSHPSGNPDFHHRDCFSHKLGAAKGT